MDLKDFPNILGWYGRLNQLKGFDESESGAKNFAEMFENIWKTSQA